MPRYEIILTRTLHQHASLIVEADHPSAACEQVETTLAAVGSPAHRALLATAEWADGGVESSPTVTSWKTVPQPRRTR